MSHQPTLGNTLGGGGRYTTNPSSILPPQTHTGRHTHVMVGLLSIRGLLEVHLEISLGMEGLVDLSRGGGYGGIVGGGGALVVARGPK